MKKLALLAVALILYPAPLRAQMVSEEAHDTIPVSNKATFDVDTMNAKQEMSEISTVNAQPQEEGVSDMPSAAGRRLYNSLSTQGPYAEDADGVQSNYLDVEEGWYIGNDAVNRYRISYTRGVANGVNFLDVNVTALVGENDTARWLGSIHITAEGAMTVQTVRTGADGRQELASQLWELDEGGSEANNDHYTAYTLSGFTIDEENTAHPSWRPGILS